MKKIIVVIIIIIVLLGIALLWPTSPDKNLDVAEVSQNKEMTGNSNQELFENNEIENILNNLDILITGFGPGKSHPGTFKEYKVTDVKVNESGLISSGTTIINALSREFDIAGLNQHLCADNFFDCEKYKEIKFELIRIEKISDSSWNVVGNLTFKGTTKTISAPVNKIGDKFESQFRLNVAQFGFTYPAVNDEVEILIKNK